MEGDMERFLSTHTHWAPLAVPNALQGASMAHYISKTTMTGTRNCTGWRVRKALVITLLLLAILSTEIFSKSADCQRSFDLGKADAGMFHRSGMWFVIGIGTVILASRISMAIDSLQYPSTSYSEPPSLVAPAIGFFTVLVIPFIPAFLFPKRQDIFPYTGAVDLECYRDGYKTKAGLKNAGSLLLGELTISAVAVVGMWILFAALFY
jgi:hypothetical protein